MGLIGDIKLSLADRACRKADYESAERKYQEILSSHPQAAAHYASMLLDRAKASKKDRLSLLAKAVSLTNTDFSQEIKNNLVPVISELCVYTAKGVQELLSQKNYSSAIDYASLIAPLKAEYTDLLVKVKTSSACDTIRSGNGSQMGVIGELNNCISENHDVAASVICTHAKSALKTGSNYATVRMVSPLVGEPRFLSIFNEAVIANTLTEGRIFTLPDELNRRQVKAIEDKADSMENSEIDAKIKLLAAIREAKNSTSFNEKLILARQEAARTAISNGQYLTYTGIYNTIKAELDGTSDSFKETVKSIRSDELFNYYYSEAFGAKKDSSWILWEKFMKNIGSYSGSKYEQKLICLARQYSAASKLTESNTICAFLPQEDVKDVVTGNFLSIFFHGPIPEEPIEELYKNASLQITIADSLYHKATETALGKPEKSVEVFKYLSRYYVGDNLFFRDYACAKARVALKYDRPELEDKIDSVFTFMSSNGLPEVNRADVYHLLETSADSIIKHAKSDDDFLKGLSIHNSLRPYIPSSDHEEKTLSFWLDMMEYCLQKDRYNDAMSLKPVIKAKGFNISDSAKTSSETRINELAYTYLSAKAENNVLSAEMWNDFRTNIESYSGMVHRDEILSIARTLSGKGRYQESNDICSWLSQENVSDIVKENIKGIFSDPDKYDYPDIQVLYGNAQLHDFIARQLWGMAGNHKKFSIEKKLSLYKYADPLLKNEQSFTLSYLKAAAEVALKEGHVEDDLAMVFSLADKRSMPDSGITELLDIASDFLKSPCKRKTLSYPVSLLLRKRRADFSRCFIDSAFARLKDGQDVEKEDLYDAICKEADPVPDMATLAGLLECFKDQFLNALISKLSALSNDDEGQIPEYLSIIYTNYGHPSLIEDLLACEDQMLANTLADIFVTERERFLNSSNAISSYGIGVLQLKDKDFVCSCLFALLKDGFDLDYSYQKAVNASLEELDIAGRLARVNIAISIRPELFSEEKLALAREYVSSGDYDTAIIICQELPDNQNVAEVLYDSHLARYKGTENLVLKADDLTSAMKCNQTYSMGKEKELNSYAVSLADAMVVIGDNDKASELLCHFPCSESCKKYCEIKVNQAGNAESASKAASIILDAIEQSASFSGFRNNLNAFDTLIENAVLYAIRKSEHQFPDKAIKDLETSLKLINAHSGGHTEASTAKITHRLHDLCIQAAKDAEEEKNYDYASKLYLKADANEKDRVSQIRSAICLVKDDGISINDCIKAYDSVRQNRNGKEMKDLANRLVLRLISEGQISKAKGIAEDVLKDESIIALCESYRLRLIRNEVIAFNEKINAIKNGTLALDDAQGFLKAIPDIAKQIGKDYPEYQEKILSYEPLVKSYTFRKMIYGGSSSKAFASIKGKAKDLITDRETLKSLVVAAMAAIEGGELNDNNYKEIISVWLTGINMDQLIVDSLALTTWDDGYTFTLRDSLGRSSEEDYDFLPDNVNFDEKSDTCVAIAEVQSELLERGEAAISEIGGEIYDFFKEQKSAMDSLRLLIREDERCLIMPPYIYCCGIPQKYWTSLREFLDTAAKRLPGLILTGYSFEFAEPDETPYTVGYIYGIHEGDYQKYHEAQEAKDACIKAADSLKNILRTFTKAKLDLIFSFDGLHSKFIDEIKSDFDKHFSSNKQISKIQPPLTAICKAVNDDSLSYKLTDYVNGYVVKRLNNDEMAVEEGLPLLLDAYELFNGNDQLKSNISKVLESLVFKYMAGDTSTGINDIISRAEDFHDGLLSLFSDQNLTIFIMTGNRSNVEQILDKIWSPANSGKINAIRKKILNIDVQKELSEIIDAVNEKRMTTLTAYRKMERLYTDHPNETRVYENYCIITKNAAQESKIDISTAYNVLSREYSRHASSATVRSTYASILLMQAQKNIIQPYTALEKIDSIYQAYSSDSEICELLAISAINAILGHIREGDSYAIRTRTLLDTLYSNRSSTFKLKARPQFLDTFNNIKGQFDEQTWSLLKPSGYRTAIDLITLQYGSPQKILSEEGTRMKRAIEYIYKFSQY